MRRRRKRETHDSRADFIAQLLIIYALNDFKKSPYVKK